MPSLPLSLRLLPSRKPEPGGYEVDLTAALNRAAACHARFEQAITLLALSGLAVARGDMPVARAHAMDARAICEPLDARPALARIVALEHANETVG